MHRLLLVVVVALLAVGCGNDEREGSLGRPDSTETGAPPAAEAAAPTTPGLTTPATARARRLSNAEQRRLESIANSIERAVVLFDRSARACPDATWEGCVDRAWSVLVGDLDWPPYYLRRYAARTRGCEPLAVAVQGVNGFNLAARQVDYGDPDEYATPTRRRDYLALVDGLRPVPDELRTAAASRCN
jgi:hypothetical protein